MNDDRNLPSIFAQDSEQLREIVEQQWNMPKFRSSQLLHWLFQHRNYELDTLSNLSKDFKDKLKKTFDWSLPEVCNRLDGQDGASKLLLKGTKGQIFEAVILRYAGRTSLCVSSQVGCRLACNFCQTGKLGFFRNLKAGEIIGQFILANKLIAKENRKISHIVFMGMGEPLDNFNEVKIAVNLLTKPECFGLSPRRVTVSTSGIAPKIRDFSEHMRASLALSLHASRDDLRSELMPINKRYSLEELKQALFHYQNKTQEKITIEYILIKNKNCGIKEAKELVRFLHGLKAKINLIPFNSHPGMEYQRPSEQEITSFQKYLSQRGYPAPVRYSKGLDVSAACGQLAAKHETMLKTPPKRKNVIGG